MSTNEVTQDAKPKMTEAIQKNKKRFLIIAMLLVLVVGIIGAVIGFGGMSSISESQLEAFLAKEGEDTITLNGNVKVSKEIVVTGQKTILGKGQIILVNELDGEWEEEGKNNSWGMGCAQLKAEDTTKMSAFLTVSEGATLTLSENVVVDAAEKANAIQIKDGGNFIIEENVIVKNGRYANLVVEENATVEVNGGTIADALVHGIINKGTLKITGGTISGGKGGALLYNEGTATQSGGTITDSKVHNVYVAAGTFTMTGGSNENAIKDGVTVAKDAKVIIKDGEIVNCNHGLCNNGNAEVGAITLKESGIMNYSTGTLTLDGTTVDTAAVYCLANNGGKVVANDFTAAKCDTCAIYNFSGDMELNNVKVTGSRDGNIANAAGNLMVNGGILEECNDKSIVVGNGKAVFKNVTLDGTSREKYGVYVFGGEMYMTDSTLANISSTAFKVDAGGYVEIKDITMKDIAQNAFQCEGGIVVAENLTIENLGSHGVYNNGGEVTVTDISITGIKKNAIQHKGGTTIVTGFQADTIGNHGGYVEKGTLTIVDSSFKNMSGNGFYVIDEENELSLKDVVIDTTGDQGLNVSSKVNIENVTICNTSKNGIYNKQNGSVAAKNVTIYNTGDHGISNVSTMTIDGLSVKNTGKEKNSVQNTGTITIANAVLKESDNHGIYNTGKLTGSKITIEKTAKNGVYNAEGNAVIDGLSINGTREHGVNNIADLTVSNLTVSNTGDGKNNIQNAGKIDVVTAVLSESKNHGVYNTGTFTGKDITVTDAAVNGVYNTAGTITINGLNIDGAGEHGVNNEATVVLSNITIANTGVGKNNIQNTGTANVSSAVLKNSKNHGVYNTGTFTGKDITVKDAAVNGVYNTAGSFTSNGLNIDGTGEHGVNNEATVVLLNVTIANTGAEKNSIQNSGKVSLTTALLKASKNHGIYNSGTLSGTDITVLNPAKNGVYNAGGTVTSIEKLTVNNAGDQAINNTGKFTVSNVNIDKTVANGIYNNGGTLVANDVTISNTGEHGVNNTGGTMTLTSANISNPGAGKNGIQNDKEGTLTANAIVITGSVNHGIYNNAVLNSTGTITITDIAQNGIYNYNDGEATLATLEMTDISGHGVNNSGQLTIKVLSVEKAGGVDGNSVQNTGTMTISQSAVIYDSGKHGLYNGGTFEGNNIVIKNTGDLGLSNSGELEIRGLMFSGKASKAIYNNGYAELYKATIDGAEVSNSSAEYLIDNNGGVLDINDTTIKNAKGAALHNRGNAHTNVTNVVINTAGNYGTFVESGSSLSGDGLEINNIAKGFDGAEGMPIKNAGKITMLDHVTIGVDDPDVTGSGVDVATELTAIVNNAIVNDATTAGYSGYDLVINNATSGCAIYNKGYAFITDFEAINPKDGIVSRYSGWTTLAGTIKLIDVSRNPITTYGKENNNYVNGITLAPGSDMILDGAGSHAINNKGSFLADADSDITIKNVIGTNINAVNNNTGTMTLGNVTIDNVRTEITMYNDTTINSNAGNAIQTSGKLTIDGIVNISNIFYKAANDKTDNSNGSGVVVKNGGSIDGNGSIIINGNEDGEEYKGIHNGIFVTKCTIDLKGDITVDTAKNQGIYVADANAYLKAGNITISNVGGNGIYINNATGKLVSTGTIKATNMTKGRGLNNAGVVETVNLEISGVTGYAGIENSKEITATGNVTVYNVAKGPGIRNKGKMTVSGTTTIHSISGTGVNGIQQDGGKTMNLNNVVIYDITANEAKENFCNGIHNKGTINLTGTAEIYNITNDAATKDAERAGIVNLGTIKGTGNLYIHDVAGHGVYNVVTDSSAGKIELSGKVTMDRIGKYGIFNNAGTITVNEVDVKNTNNIGIFMQSNATLTSNVVTVDTANGQCIQLNHANTLTVGTLTVKNTTKNGLRLYNNNGNPTVTIQKLVAENCSEYALAAQKQLTSENLSITTLQHKNCATSKNGVAVHGNIKSGVGTVEELQ